MRFKPAVKSAIAACSAACAPAGGRPRRVVLCYHSIHPANSFASATPESFAAHLAWLTAECDVVPFARIADARPAGAKPAVAVTFDDGYADNHRYALPILARSGATATFFLTAGMIERDPAVLAHVARDRSCPVGQIAAMDWPQVRELQAAGMDIGGHTWSHPNLARLSVVELDRELRGAKQVIEDRLGCGITAMAYPYGKRDRHFTGETVRAVAAAGYLTAAAVLFRGIADSDDLRALPRFFINGGDDLRSLRAKVRGDWDAIGWWQEHSPGWAARLLSPSDFAQEALRA
jgi:peptidoglycan/xylan/chitin deacetylase (PgdA/CDA1 family)